MALKTYIGARYAPQFMGEFNSTLEYKPLSVVYSGGISYTSRTYVPSGSSLTNTQYWIKSADYNAQVAQYRQEVQQYASQIDDYKQEVDKYVETVTRLDNQMQTFTTSITNEFNKFKQEVNNTNQQMQENFNQQVEEVKAFADETLHSFDNKAAMVADKDLKEGQTVLTCGGDTIGDGKASFYQVQGSSASDTVALANGKFAKPFKLQAYETTSYNVIEPRYDGYYSGQSTNQITLLNLKPDTVNIAFVKMCTGSSELPTPSTGSFKVTVNTTLTTTANKDEYHSYMLCVRFIHDGTSQQKITSLSLSNILWGPTTTISINSSQQTEGGIGYQHWVFGQPSVGVPLIFPFTSNISMDD